MSDSTIFAAHSLFFQPMKDETLPIPDVSGVSSTADVLLEQDDRIFSPIPSMGLEGDVGLVHNLVLVEGNETYSVDFVYNINGEAIDATTLLPSKYKPFMKEIFEYFNLSSFSYDPKGKKIITFIVDDEYCCRETVFYQEASDGELYRVTPMTKNMLQGNAISSKSCKFLDVSEHLQEYSEEEKKMYESFMGKRMSFEKFERKLLNSFLAQKGTTSKQKEILFHVGNFREIDETNCHYQSSFIYAFHVKMSPEELDGMILNLYETISPNASKFVSDSDSDSDSDSVDEKEDIFEQKYERKLTDDHKQVLKWLNEKI